MLLSSSYVIKLLFTDTKASLLSPYAGGAPELARFIDGFGSYFSRAGCFKRDTVSVILIGVLRRTVYANPKLASGPTHFSGWLLRAQDTSPLMRESS